MKDIYIPWNQKVVVMRLVVPIVKNGREEALLQVTSSQIDIHENFGGVVPEIASRRTC